MKKDDELSIGTPNFLKKLDWFDKCKWLMFAQGFGEATSIYAIILVINNEEYRWLALAYFIITQIFTFVAGRLVSVIRAENEKTLNINVKQK